MNDHLRPVGKPAPPRPRNPESFISWTIQSRPLWISSLVPSHAPRARAPARCQSPWPYRLVKMRSWSASICVLPDFGQRGLPGQRHRALAADHRADRRLLAGDQCVEQLLGRRPIEVFVEIIVDLKDRRVDAGPEAFDLDQRELSVGGAVPRIDPELLLAGRDDVLRAAQPARGRRAGLQEPAS